MTPFSLRCTITDDGMLNVFIFGADGIPVTRLKNPVPTGEDAIALYDEWIRNWKQEAGIEDVEFQESAPLGALQSLWFRLRRLWARTHARSVP
jgi:hypothetical protein